MHEKCKILPRLIQFSVHWGVISFSSWRSMSKVQQYLCCTKSREQRSTLIFVERSWDVVTTPKLVLLVCICKEISLYNLKWMILMTRLLTNSIEILSECRERGYYIVFRSLSFEEVKNFLKILELFFAFTRTCVSKVIAQRYQYVRCTCVRARSTSFKVFEFFWLWVSDIGECSQVIRVSECTNTWWDIEALEQNVRYMEAFLRHWSRIISARVLTLPLLIGTGLFFQGQLRRLKSNWQHILGSGPHVCGTS